MMDFLRGKVTAQDWIAVAVILGIAGALIAVFTMVINKSQLEELQAARQLENDNRVKLESAKQIAAEIDGLREEVERIEVLVRDFERRLPTSRELRILVGEIENMANESDLVITVNNEKSLRDARKETIPYSVTAYGSFHQIVTFINLLERYERYVKVSELHIEEEKDGISRADFTLSTFVFIEQQPTTPAQAGAQS